MARASDHGWPGQGGGAGPVRCAPVVVAPGEARGRGSPQGGAGLSWYHHGAGQVVVVAARDEDGLLRGRGWGWGPGSEGSVVDGWRVRVSRAGAAPGGAPEAGGQNVENGLGVR